MAEQDEFTEVKVEGGFDEEDRLHLQMVQSETGVRISLVLDLTESDPDQPAEDVSHAMHTMLKQSAEVVQGMLKALAEGQMEGMLMIDGEGG